MTRGSPWASVTTSEWQRAAPFGAGPHTARCERPNAPGSEGRAVALGTPKASSAAAMAAHERRSVQRGVVTRFLGILAYNTRLARWDRISAVQ